MNNIVEELQDIFDQLQSFVDKANENSTVKSLIKLENVANEVGKSWSGSWLGYQSRIYYKGFIPVPAGAHFSIEWGAYQNLTQDTRGDWVECQFDYVEDYIKAKASNPDLKQASSIAKNGRELFEEKSNAILSILETYFQHRKDTFTESLIEKVKDLKIPTGSGWIEIQRPHGTIMSRDSLAMSQGIWTPPHISIIADIFDIRSHIYACGELAKHTKTAASHIYLTRSQIAFFQRAESARLAKNQDRICELS